MQFLTKILQKIQLPRSAERAVASGSDFDLVPAALVRLDASGVIVCFNLAAERLFGFDRNEAVGASLELLLQQSLPTPHSDDGFSSDETLLRLFARRKGGAAFPAEAVVRLDDTGGCTILFQDVSSRRDEEYAVYHAVAAAESSARAKSDFLACMSHEIRTPMNVIIGMCELLAESPLNREQRRQVELLRGSGENLLNVINDILDLSKIESGHLELEQAEFDLVSCLERSCQLLGVKAFAKGVELVCDISSEVPTRCIGDSNRFQQILLNLLGNAVKFTSQGEVVLRATMSDSCVLTVSVRDTGIGIATEQQETIFERFAQANSSTTRSYGGTGLGLSIVRQLVTLMGGVIWVDSAPGHGSTFSCAIPCRPVPQTTGGDWPGAGDCTVLVLDDNEACRAALEELVRLSGSRVVDLQQALSCWRGVEDPGLLYDGFDKMMLLTGQLDPGRDYAALEQWLVAPTSSKKVIFKVVATGDQQVLRNDDLEVLQADHLVAKPVTRAVLQEAFLAMRGESLDHAAKKSNVATVSSMRILLADDCADNRTVVFSYLKGQPVTIDIAEDGQRAFELFQRFSYDLVLMDVQMPVLDGYQATRLIRDYESSQGRSQTPILALTAHALPSDREKSLAAGCTEHLVKPLLKKDLLKTLDQYGAGVKQRLSGKIVIELDAELETLLPGYLVSRRQALVELRSALASGDYETVRRVGHQMKGTGSSYGLELISELGGALEDMAVTVLATPDRAAQLHGEMGQAVARCEDYLAVLEVNYV